MSKRGLGRGLGALIPTFEPQQEESVHHIAIDDIHPNPYQPRREFDQDKLAELVQSISEHGIIQPIIIRKVDNGYQLVAGERRWRAARIAELDHLPAVVRNYDDAQMMEIALIENLQREQLNPLEEAQAYQRLLVEFGLTQEQVAAKVGRSRSLVANTLRLLHLPEAIQAFVSRGTLTMGHARPLLAIDNEELQIAAANYIVSESLSVRDTEEYVRRMADGNQPSKKENKKIERELPIIQAEEQLRVVFGTKVFIKPGKLKGKIEIEYYSDEDLQRIMDAVGLGDFS